MGIFLDTSFLIACANAKDENHAFAAALQDRIKQKEFGQCFISEYIFDEFVTFLRAKKFPESVIRERGDALLQEKSIEFLSMNSDFFSSSWDFFKKSTGFSFTDCTTIILSNSYGIKTIASFDADFDKSGMKRIFRA